MEHGPRCVRLSLAGRQIVMQIEIRMNSKTGSLRLAVDPATMMKHGSWQKAFEAMIQP